MEININILLIGITLFSNFFLAFLTLSSSKRNHMNILFSLLIFVLNIWIIVNYLSYLYIDPDKAFYLAKLVLFFAILIGYFFYLFIDVFIKNKFIIKPTTIFITILTIINLFLTMNSKFFSGMLIINDSLKPIVEPWIILFSILPVGIIIYSIFRLIKKAKNITGLDREKTLSILIGSGIMFFFIILFNFVFPSLFSNTTLIPLGGLFTIPFTALTTYAIIKYQLFNIKVITTELIIFVLWLFILIRTLISNTQDEQIINGILLLILIIVGILLIRSVKKEVKQREELAKLNVDLRILVKQRESLMHLINHKVKGSFTHSKYIFAGMLDGTFGEVNDEVKKRAQQGLDSDNGGIATVDLILNAANLQNGTIRYEKKEVNIKEVLNEVLENKKVGAEAKKLELKSDIKEGEYKVLGDANWLKEAMSNLIENSIRYTREGSINVKLEKINGKILLSVKDTGVGISDEDKKGLFTEGGRGKESVKINTDSTGYGLYSVKLIIEEHKGRVWGESDGPGKGSSFYIELNSL